MEGGRQSYIGHSEALSSLACCGDHIISAADSILVWRLSPELGNGAGRGCRRAPCPAQSSEPAAVIPTMRPEPVTLAASRVSPPFMHAPDSTDDALGSPRALRLVGRFLLCAPGFGLSRWS